MTVVRFLLRLFGEESAFGRFLNRLYVVIVTNLLFVLFSVPVVTIGASLSAMNYTLMKFQRGDRQILVFQILDLKIGVDLTGIGDLRFLFLRLGFICRFRRQRGKRGRRGGAGDKQRTPKRKKQKCTDHSFFHF